ncbi:carbohydrate kinase [Rhizobium sp. Leaf306]|uniref:ribokinase n=1 Tax=Rhizobium sp. Leaf306 TaxID=1736330 RepID=UPI0007132948|nr:ribokinase [Rhizobium sp. Leaf306]KQQ35586.1 carbohydrate kinase [Rhizobium sp. Leaf306]
MTASSPAVVVFGSLHYDIIVKGPARPRKGETVTGSAWNPACGGKGGNQAVSAAKAGVRSAMIGAVGDDDFGHTLLDNLAANAVELDQVRVIDGAASGMSVAIFDAEGDYGAVIVSGSNLQLGQSDVAQAEHLFRAGNILVLQNEVPDAANVLAASAMKQVGGRVVLNAAPARDLSPELARLIDVLVVNAVEAEALAGGGEVETLKDAIATAEVLAQSFPVAVVTAGGEGVAFAEQCGAKGTIPAIKVNLVSTHGAGDEFIGVLAAQMLQGESVTTALSAANQAAALLVSSQR